MFRKSCGSSEMLDSSGGGGARPRPEESTRPFNVTAAGCGRGDSLNHLPVRHHHPLRDDHDAVADVEAVAVHVRVLAAIVDGHVVADPAVLVQDGPLDVAVVPDVEAGDPIHLIPLPSGPSWTRTAG